jgi:thiamine-phosphate pyrophosphorylase
VLRDTAARTEAVTIGASLRGLYAITPDGVDAKALVRMVSAALKGGARLIQYRQKSAGPRDQAVQARELNELCAASGASLIINDNVELAQQINAAGVHLGRDDMNVIEARRQLGTNKIIGVSCYNQMALAEAAIGSSADYIAFGAFFPSQIKPHAVRAELALIVDAKKKFNIPIVAIGGISLQNAPQLIAAGADAIAVISDLFNASNITAQASAFQQLFSKKD